jgi:hypothetical protein
MRVNEHPTPPPEGELITEALKRMRPKVSIREAARRAGISDSWWRQVVRGYQPLRGGGRAPMQGSAETVASMASVVGVTPEQLAAVGREDAAEELRLLEAERTPDDLDQRPGESILDHRTRVTARSVLQHSRQIDALRMELDRLRGRVEALESERRQAESNR